MALKQKNDPFELAAEGWTLADVSFTPANSTVYAQGSLGWTVASDIAQHSNTWVYSYLPSTYEMEVPDLRFGQVIANSEGYGMLVGATFTSQVGQPMTMQLHVVNVENGFTTGNTHCSSRLRSLTEFDLLGNPFHAHRFGLLTIINCQLQSSTFTVTHDVVGAYCNGELKATDLQNGMVTLRATLLGVKDNGDIAVWPQANPSSLAGIPPNKVIDMALTNPNGQYPTYEIEVQWPIAPILPT